MISARVAALSLSPSACSQPLARRIWAAFGLGANAAQMRRASGWLQALGDSESAATRALITSIYTHHDNIIAPQASSELEGARNLAFGGVGHVALGRNPRVLDAVMEEVARP